MEFVDPSFLVGEVERDLTVSRNVLCVYWVHVQGDRDAYATAVRAIPSSWPIVPIVLRHHGFDSPNSVFQDLMEVVQGERPSFEEPSLRTLASSYRRIAVVLIARTELAVPQVQSPARLPDWFPVAAGEQVGAYLKDLTWNVNVPLKSPDVKGDSIARLLFGVEGALQTRLRSQREIDRHCTAGLLEKLRTDKINESLDEILQLARAHRDTVSDPGSFRPSRRDRKALIARIWDFYMKNGPEQLLQYARPLAVALRPQLRSGSFTMPLQALILRPTGPMPEEDIQWALCLIISIGAGCQLLTAIAHSDEYPRYPSLVLRALSLDIRKFLQEATENLE